MPHHFLRVGILFAGALTLLLLLAPVTCHPAFSSRFTSFLARPLVSRALLVRRFSAFARDFPLFGSIHRSKSTVLFCHRILPLPGSNRCRVCIRATCARPAPTLGLQPMCHRNLVSPIASKS